jgi:hypothetical protein
LRNRIYEYLDFGGRVIVIAMSDRKTWGCQGLIEPYERPGLYHYKKERTYAQTVLGLLQVCHQIYADTRLLPFMLNTFEEYNLESLQRWHEKMPTQLGAIRSYRTYTRHAEIHGQSLEAIPFLPGLERLEVGVDVSGLAVRRGELHQKCNLCPGYRWYGEPHALDFRIRSEDARYHLDQREAAFRANLLGAMSCEIEVEIVWKNGWTDMDFHLAPPRCTCIRGGRYRSHRRKRPLVTSGS